MDFNEKLRELRKERSLTQEELAEALFVSRTAVSKWESGRGYPSIDSLKELSRYFSVSIDELICTDEIIEAAEGERTDLVCRYTERVCAALDALLVVLLLIPAFGNGAESTSTVTLTDLTGISSWLRCVFAVLVGGTALVGLAALAVAYLGGPEWGRRLLVWGMVLSVVTVAVLMVSRQPYAGIVCFALLVTKALLICQGGDVGSTRPCGR